MNEVNFKIAYEIIIADFCAQAQKKGMTLEEAKAFLIRNQEVVADRIKGLMAEIK